VEQLIAPTRAMTTQPVVRPAMRLTRRGRLAIVLLVMVASFVLFSIARVTTDASSTPSGPATRAVVVQPGQTLWQIAEQIRPGVDPRETIIRIQSLNGFDGGVVHPGQQLVVPA